MLLRFTFLLCIGGATLAPLSAFGHSGEFLLAHLTVLPNREVRLEITADYGENPMIGSVEEARALIPEILLLQSMGKAQALGELAPVKFKKHGNLDPTAPLPVLPGEAEKVHELLTGTWQWKPSRGSLRFEVPKWNPHNVLLWVTDEQMGSGKSRWNMLIAGDVSPAIALPRASGFDGKFVIITLIACLGMGVVWGIRKRIV